MKKAKILYYNEQKQVDKFTTYINNHTWFLPVWFILSFLLIGFVEGM